MNLNIILNDVQMMQDHIHSAPEEALKLWTPIKCELPQLPLIRLIGFLTDAGHPPYEEKIQLRAKPQHQAIIDIVKNSNLCSLLEYDAHDNCVRYRPEIPMSAREAIAKFISGRGIVLAD